MNLSTATGIGSTYSLLPSNIQHAYPYKKNLSKTLQMYSMINIPTDFVTHAHHWDVLPFKDTMFGKSNMP